MAAWLRLLLVLLLPASWAAADDVGDPVRQAEAERLAAMVRADLPALGRLLTDDCLYVHSNGRTQTKAGLLAALQSGAIRYDKLEHAGTPAVRLYGDAAVLTSTLRVEAVAGSGGSLKASLLVTAVYVRQDGRWRLASYQSTVAPP